MSETLEVSLYSLVVIDEEIVINEVVINEEVDVHEINIMIEMTRTDTHFLFKDTFVMSFPIDLSIDYEYIL